jgi:hypothetical protein
VNSSFHCGKCLSIFSEIAGVIEAAPRFTKSTISAIRALYRKGPAQEKINFTSRSGRLYPQRNPKSEGRNPKEIRRPRSEG